MSATPPAFDCPGNYVAGAPSLLRCAKCNRTLAVKDAVRTPTGYVCPLFVKARVATFYNATPIHTALLALLSVPIGALAGFLLSLVGGISFISLMLIGLLAPAAGGAIGELLRSVFKKTRGQYFWLAAAGGVSVGAAWFVLAPLLRGLASGNLNALWGFIPLFGLGLLLSTLIARMRV